MRKYITPILMMMLFMVSMRSYSDEIDTIAIINIQVSDTLTDIEALFYERTLRHEKAYNIIDNSNVFLGEDYFHNPVPFMTSEMEMGDSSILILVDEITFQNISPYLLRYASDIYYGTNYDVYVERVQNASHTQIKDLILSYQNGLAGVVLIGDIADAKFEQRYNDEYTSWPCELYYMDLDGLWKDEKDSANLSMPNGIYEKHEGDVKPEIFVGRISTMGVYGSALDKLFILKSYFNKNHDFWLGMRNACNHRALTYVEYPWRMSEDKMEGIKDLFGIGGFDARRHGDAGFGKNQYMNLIQNGQYDFIQLCAHSGPKAHWFSTGIDSINVYGDILYSFQIANLVTTPIGFSLFSCQACDWNFDKSYFDKNNICDSYIYNNGNTLFVVGSTKSGGMNNTKNFFKPLGQGLSVGEAFKQWFVKTPGNTHDAYDVLWFYGMCIIGDPLISMMYDATDFCPDTLVLTSVPRDTLYEVTYQASQKIIVQDDFQIPNGMHVIFDAPEIDFAPNFTCTMGGTFETRGIGCVCSRGGTPNRNNISARKTSHSYVREDVAFSISPNPVNDILHIQSPEVFSHVYVYNINGHQILQTNNTELNVSALPQGMYLLRAITTDGQLRQAKFIKQ